MQRAMSHFSWIRGKVQDPGDPGNPGNPGMNSKSTDLDVNIHTSSLTRFPIFIKIQEAPQGIPKVSQAAQKAPQGTPRRPKAPPGVHGPQNSIREGYKYQAALAPH